VAVVEAAVVIPVVVDALTGVLPAVALPNEVEVVLVLAPVPVLEPVLELKPTLVLEPMVVLPLVVELELLPVPVEVPPLEDDPLVTAPLVLPTLVALLVLVTMTLYAPGGRVTTNAASLLPFCSVKAPTFAKSCAVASSVVKDSPVASVPVTVPIVDVPEIVPVLVDEPVAVDEPVLVDEPLLELLPNEPADAPPLRTAALPQPLFVASACCPRNNVSDGLAIGLRTPNGVSPGPTARMSTRRGIVPAMTKPTVEDSPTSSVERTETFDSGAAFGMSANENRPVVVLVPCTVV
jgi:hypothetical protein